MKLVIGTLNFLWILPLILSKDAPVTCFYSEECVLPCQSTYHNIIHWYKGQEAVHSFYEGKDQLAYQDKEYKGRTSLLSPSKINEGNVSLLLKSIRIQDKGKYKCYAASDILNEEKFVVVSVIAPVKSVDITIKNGTVTCSTNRVYPKPTVLWSSDPPAKDLLYNHNETDEKLFAVTSELKIGNISDVYTYNCSIKNTEDKTLYTASLKQQEISVEDEITLPCPFTKDNSFILSFSTTVLSYDSKNSKQQIPDEWKDKVSFQPEDGTIKLHNLNKEHMGTYTCKTTTAQNITLTSTKHILSGTEDTFKCPVTKDQNYNTTLIFETTILHYDSQTSEKQILDQWRNKITFPSEDTGAVKLSSLNQKQHSGTYTCDSTTANTRYIIHTKVTLTGVKAHATLAIVIPLLILVLILAIVIYYVVIRKKLCSNNDQTAKESEQGQPLNSKASHEVAMERSEKT